MQDRLTPDQIQFGLRLASEATARPWVECKSGPDESSIHHIEVDLCIAAARMAENAEGYIPLRSRDARYITHACNHHEAALRELLDLRREVEELRGKRVHHDDLDE